MPDIILTGPVSGQVLVYNELTNSLENATLTPSMLSNFQYIKNATSIGSQNSVAVYNDTIAGTARFRSLIGADGITVSQVGSDVRISFNGDATTLNGLNREGFLQVSNALGDIDALQARNNLNVMSADEMYDSFLEANTSNVPDTDNAYDMGSNGRRFANMFAVNFHGHASSASIANKLARNGATEGQMLVWRNASSDWVPENTVTNRLSTLTDVDPNNLTHESVLVYNAVRGKWEMVPSSFFAGGGGGGGSMTAANTGTSTGVFSTILGNSLQFRTLRAGNNVNISLNFDGTEVVIGANVPQSTTDLVEGDNKYYTRQKLLSDLATISIQQLGGVDTTTSPIAGQAPVWDGQTWKWRSVAVGLSSTDGLAEGNTNLYFTDSRARAAVEQFIDTDGINLSDLRDVVASPSNNDVLVYDSASNKWVAKKVSMRELGDVNATNLQNNSVLVWNAVSSTFVAGTLPTNLEHLGSTPASMAFNQTSFNTMFGNKSTSDLPEGATNKYLTAPNLIAALPNASIGDLGDVSLDNISVGNILAWDGSGFVASNPSDISVTVEMSMVDLDDVDAAAFSSIANGQVLAWNSITEDFRPVSIPNTINGSTDVTITSLQAGHGLVWDGVKYVNRRVVASNSAFGDGDIVTYNATTDSFVNSPISAIQSNLLTIDGVQYNALQNGHVLVYNAAISKFQNTQPNMSMLGDVNSPIDNATIVYNASTQNYEHRAFALTSLSGVSITTPSNSEYLSFNLNGEVVNKELDLSALSDVALSNLAANDLLKYDATSQKFVNGQLRLSELSDVTDATPFAGSVLMWNGTQYTNGSAFTYDPLSLNDGDIPIFRNGVLDFQHITSILGVQAPTNNTQDPDDPDYDPNALAQNAGTPDGAMLVYDEANNGFRFVLPSNALAGMSDVDLSGVQDGFVLTYDDASETYVMRTPSAVGNLGDLGDVDTAGATVDQFLAFDGNEWVPRTVSVVTSLDSLTDTSITNPTLGQVLTFNGSAWVAANPTGGSGGGGTAAELNDLNDVMIGSTAAGQVLVFNGSAFVNEKLSYADLTNKPTLAPVATSGSYNDLTNKPTLSTVAASGSYNDLTNKPNIPTLPNLATVATSGSYDDLTNKPSIPTLPNLAPVATSGSYNDLTNKPTIPTLPNLADVATSGNYADLVNTPSLATVATSGSYNDLTNKPTIPTLPNLADVATSGDYDDLNNAPVLSAVATSGDYDDLSNAPSLATVATSGSYNDLTNKPNIPTLPNLAPVATSGSYNDLTNKPTIPTLPNLAPVATSGSYNDLTNKPTIPSSLNDLSNVSVASPSNGQVLTYSNGLWVPTTPSSGGGSGGGASALNDLNDVDFSTAPVAGDIMKFDGTKWVPSAPMGGMTFRKFRINYAGNRQPAGAIDTSDAFSEYTPDAVPVLVRNNSANDVIVEINFTGFKYPPASIMFYGWDASNNWYNPKLCHEQTAMQFVPNNTVVASNIQPSAFGNFDKIRLQISMNETGAAHKLGLPAVLSHAYVMFCMGE